MLGIILIIFIGRSFFKLSEEYNQNKWVFPILGIITYYAGTFIGGIILGVFDEILGLGLDWDNTLMLTFIALPFGLGSAYLLYTLLNKNWKKTVVIERNEIQDIGKNIED
jgi:hypothetical protein